MPIVDNKGKTFEKPDNGLFIGVLADVVDLGLQNTNYGPKKKVRLVWLLDAKDKEGNNYRVMQQCTASLNEKARLYAIVKDVLDGVAPPVPYELDNMIGKVNQLFIAREKSPDGTKEFSNIKAIAPAGGKTFAIPAGFVRQKDKPQNQNGVTTGGTQQAATQPAPAAPAQATAPAPAAAPAAAVSGAVNEDIPF